MPKMRQMSHVVSDGLLVRTKNTFFHVFWDNFVKLFCSLSK